MHNSASQVVDNLKLNPSRNRETNVDQGSVIDISNYSLDTPYDRLKCLFKVVSSAPYLDSEQAAISLILELGKRAFRLSHGVAIKALSPQKGEITAVSTDEEVFYVGQHLDIEFSFGLEILEIDKSLASQAGAQISPSSKYKNVSLDTYIGAPAKPETNSAVALCFFSEGSSGREFSPNDMEFVKLLADAVSSMIDLQKVHASRKISDQAVFAMGSLKTLDEYEQQAKLPEVYGVPSRVVDVLKRRIGAAPLSIGHIAEELNLSKRTLQRRLQQQDISFAELRDQVRFHHSIDYLVRQHQSIDSISASLDFSDRTSFTNAFKRWTGLSPSTFRKLFRDYA